MTCIFDIKVYFSKRYFGELFTLLYTRKRDLTTQDVFQILLRSFHAAHCLIIEQVSKEFIILVNLERVRVF